MRPSIDAVVAGDTVTVWMLWDGDRVATDDALLTTGGRDAGLDTVLSHGLDAFNVRATGDTDQRELTVRVDDGTGAVLAGLSGWTWGTCCGISMVWVREDQRRSGWGARLLAVAEIEAGSADVHLRKDL